MGYPPHALFGPNDLGDIPPDRWDRTGTTFRKVMELDQPTHFEIQWQGNQRWYDFRIYPSGMGITVYWVDITNCKQAP